MATAVWIHRAAAIVLAGAVGLVFAVAVTLGAFALPAYDDFMRAVRRGGGEVDLGWWGYVFHTYRWWQGRWASCGVEAAILPNVDPTRHYPLLIGSVAGVNAIAVYAVCRALTPGGPRRLAVGLSATALALLWAGMPSPAETIYWFVGAVENTLPLALAAVVLVSLSRPTQNPAAIGALAAAAFVICGMHELYGAMFCIVLIVGTAAAYTGRSGSGPAWLAVTVAAVAGLLVVVLAPGNHVRLAAEGHAANRAPVRVASLAVHQMWRYGRAWLFDPKLVAATLWVAFSPTLEAARVPWPSARRVSWRWVVPATFVAVWVVGFAGPSWGFAAQMPARTLTGNYVVFVAGWLLTVYVWSRPLALPPVVPVRADRSRVVADAAALLLGGSLVCVGTMISAGEDLAQRLRPWHAAAERRFTLLRHSAGEAAVVPVLPPPPFVLLGGEIVSDPTDYRNRGPVAFFHLQRLTLAGAPATEEPATGTAGRPERLEGG